MPAFDRDLTLAELLAEDDKKKLVTELGALLDTVVALLPPDVEPRPGMSCAPLLWELETVGHLEAADVLPARLQAAARLIQLFFMHTARYRLASELHDQTIRDDYEQLREQHAALKNSEARYRALAEQLEKRVAEQVQTIQSSQNKLYQTEKLASLGRLAAGMAHEINNPLAFVTSNLSTASFYLKKLVELQSVIAEKGGPELERFWQEKKLNFVVDDFGALLADSADGLRRMAQIVADLKTFSTIDSAAKDSDDINERIRTVHRMITPEIREEICVVLDLGELPPLLCRPGHLGQVFYNLFLNAAQAIDGPGEIRIQTRMDKQEIRISISDSGKGIAAGDIARIFDPFFTTREVGHGAGLGLTVSHDIVKSHGGRIEVESRPGQGAQFTIYLPVDHA